MSVSSPSRMVADAEPDYVLDDQVGFLLRRATQRHLGIFAENIADLTPTQFAALAKLCELGRASQNELGRQTALDGATIKGVVDRLRGRGYIESEPDPTDQRRLLLRASETGRKVFDEAVAAALLISRRTLEPLNPREREQFLDLLRKLG